MNVLDRRNNKTVGVVMLNLLLFLKKNVVESDISPLLDVTGVFPVAKPHTNCNKPDYTSKIGEIEIEMYCVFERPKKIKKVE